MVMMGHGMRVMALMAPGLVVTADVRSVTEVVVGGSIRVGPLTGLITLDGERTLLAREQIVNFALEADGPWVVDAVATLRWAQRLGAFRAGATDRGAGR